MKITGPLFKWFGSKWLSSKILPIPKYDSIIEPFAGGAGYSLRHFAKDVTIYEKNVHIYELWEYLISAATYSDIREIPLNIPVGTDIRTIGLNKGQELLLKNWQRTNNVGECWTISPWGNMPGQWTESTRARISEEHSCIAHWDLGGKNGFHSFVEVVNNEVTWFIDPPYKYNYLYGDKAFDYQLMVNGIDGVAGEIIVCEAICPKTNQMPNYLPFKFWAKRITSRRKVTENHHSKELIYHRNS